MQRRKRLVIQVSTTVRHEIIVEKLQGQDLCRPKASKVLRACGICVKFLREARLLVLAFIGFSP